MDSVSAQGMTNALRDASHLSAAVVAGLGGSRPLASALHDHQRRRDRAIRGMYDFTVDLAAFPSARPGQRLFLAAVAADQRETDRFLGAFAGIVPPGDYFTLGTLVRVLGSRGIRKLTKRVERASATAPVSNIVAKKVRYTIPAGDRHSNRCG
jgi:hypothetical protein